MSIEIDLQQAFSKEVMQAKLKKVGVLLQEQVQDRIREGGDDEIKFKPLDFPRVTGERDNPLYNTGTHLLDSITHGVDHDGVWVGSTFVGSKVHQMGTKGKGGELETIRPVNAKALFIPLTPLAAKSVVVGTPTQKKRAGVGRKMGEKALMGLEKGKDFMFRSKVDIHPRPFLRVSERDAKEIAEIFVGD